MSALCQICRSPISTSMLTHSSNVTVWPFASCISSVSARVGKPNAAILLLASELKKLQIRISEINIMNEYFHVRQECEFYDTDRPAHIVIFLQSRWTKLLC